MKYIMVIAPFEIPSYFLIEIIIFITLVIIIVYRFVDRDSINNEIFDSGGNTGDINNNKISDSDGNTGDINNKISDSGDNTGKNKEVFNTIDLTLLLLFGNERSISYSFIKIHLNNTNGVVDK